MATGRYLTVREFLALIADLRLTATSFQASLLEFLERERLVLPAARIRWPSAVVIEGRDQTPPTPSTGAEQKATATLDDALRAWARYNAPAELVHPLDDPEVGAGLVNRDVGAEPFAPWETYRTNIRPAGEKPLYVDDAVDTYYHDWQALLVADALNTGARLIVDTRRPELMELAMRGRLSELPEGASYIQISFEGPRGLRDGVTWSGHLDAAAKLDVIRTRKLSEISVRRGGEPGQLTVEEVAELDAVSVRTAETALQAINADWSSMKAFITYLCERWDEHRRRGAETMANEYRRHLQRAVWLASSGLGIEVLWIIGDVGRVTGHFENTLDVIFPDLAHKRRDTLILSLRHSVVEKAPPAEADLTLDEDAIVDLVDWLERTDQWKVHLAVETILEHQFKGGVMDHAALAKEVESLGVTFEHLIDALLQEAGFPNTGTLTPKMRDLWSEVPEVFETFKTHYGLVSTKSASRADRLVQIDALTLTGPNAQVARLLLRAVLYRNAGVHGGMGHWAEAELHEASRLFLTAMMFCRRAFISCPPTP